MQMQNAIARIRQQLRYPRYVWTHMQSGIEGIYSLRDHLPLQYPIVLKLLMTLLPLRLVSAAYLVSQDWIHIIKWLADIRSEHRLLGVNKFLKSTEIFIQIASNWRYCRTMGNPGGGAPEHGDRGMVGYVLVPWLSGWGYGFRPLGGIQ